LQNPQVLLSPDALTRIQHAFAAFGPQGLVLFHQLIQAIKVSLATAITNVFFLGCIIMLLGLFAALFLREIPLRKALTPQEAEAAPSGTNRSRALLGLMLALIAREAQQPDADPQVLATLSSAVNGRYPQTWSDEQRGRAVAEEIIEPLSITLLASSLSNGGERTNGATLGTSGGTSPEEASDTLSTNSFI
jgi:hypothetical protein